MIDAQRSNDTDDCTRPGYIDDFGNRQNVSGRTG